MDRLLVSLLNTAREQPDPLESPLGTAHWWAGCGIPLPGKPRFDRALASALVRLRAWIEASVAGQAPGEPLSFTGEPSDAILFEVLHAGRIAAAGGALRRIKACAHQECARYFLDETKNSSRRWCSLRCMERARTPRRRTISR
jgi:predicted RNA-binding Zn ribbon-like protein